MTIQQSKEIYLSDVQLKSQLQLGCFTLRDAHKLPLSHIFVSISKSQATCAFWGATADDWEGTTLVNVNMYRLPEGKEEFLRQQEFFGKERKPKSKLPDGVEFDKTLLKFTGMPESWTHDAYARSNRDFIHIYQSKRMGILVRFLGKVGTILDNPLIASIASNLRVKEDQWIAEFPKTEVRSENQDENETETKNSSPSPERKKRSTTKIDLSKDKERIRRYVLKRIKDYRVNENCGPGEDEDPIQAIMLGFYASQGGYVYLVFDTRPGKNIDGEWTCFLEKPNIFPLPKWTEFFEHLRERKSGALILADGCEKEFDFKVKTKGEKGLNVYIGEMLTDLMVELSEQKAFSRLPLTKDAFMMVEEFDGDYFWPQPRSVLTKGKIRQ